MHIDWLTVAAQIVNFVVLVLLLKRFLYGPIINAMDQREQLITSQLVEADKKIEIAQQERQQFEDKTRELEQKTASILSEASAKAEQAHQQAIEKLRLEIADISKQWKQEVEHEKQDFLAHARKELALQAFGIVRRTLIDLAGVELEKLIINQFIKQLEQIDQANFDAMKEACRRSGKSLILETATQLDEATMIQLRSIINRFFGPAIDLTFKQATDFICGISLIAPARRISWNIDAYLGDIESDLSTLLKSSHVSARVQ